MSRINQSIIVQTRQFCSVDQAVFVSQYNSYLLNIVFTGRTGEFDSTAILILDKEDDSSFSGYETLINFEPTKKQLAHFISFESSFVLINHLLASANLTLCPRSPENLPPKHRNVLMKELSEGILFLSDFFYLPLKGFKHPTSYILADKTLSGVNYA